MGSSAKKKKDKKKDFQKPKLRVGKTKAKADNFTDTSFKAKSIVVNQQSLSTTAKSVTAQFTHYLSLAATSKSDTQRRDALSYLTTVIASQPVAEPLPVSSAIILPKLFPLVLDGTASVRTQLLKLLRELPRDEVKDHVETALLYIRAGMTHLAKEIRDDAVSILEWLTQTAGLEVVECAGGWVKTLKAFMSMMGWAISSEKTQWTSASKASFGKGGKSFPKQITILATFLRAGLIDEAARESYNAQSCWPLWDAEAHALPTTRNPYAYLNLFGQPRDEESEMYSERDARQRVFKKLFQQSIEKGVTAGKQEGGEIGRAASTLNKALIDGMADYSGGDY